MSEPIPVRNLDDLSLKLGELVEGQRSLNQYNHDHRHGVNNLASKIDALSLDFSKKMAELKAEVMSFVNDGNAALRSELSLANARIAALELEKTRREGASVLVRNFREWWPIILFVLGLIYGLLLTIGVVHFPSNNPTIVVPPAPAVEAKR